MFNPDSPISGVKEDLLNRAGFAEKLAQAILDYSHTTSLVIGLYGPWGDGKTSLLNMITASINSLSTDEVKSPIILKFNPWNFSTQEQLIEQFFKQLVLKLRIKEYGKEAKDIGEKLEKLSSVFTPAKFIPGFGEYAKAAQDVVRTVANTSKKVGTTYLKDLESQKDEIDKALLKLNRKILITIDDIDRLSDLEIRQIFQLVKSLGNFNNTIYLLSMDKEIVANALNSYQRSKGYDFLEKIVQVPFDIPTPEVDEVLSLVYQKMDLVIKDLDESKWDKSHWAALLHNGFKTHFLNLRDVERFISVYAFNFGLMGKEVNPIDLACITAIKVFQAELYSSIIQSKELLVGEHVSYGKNDKDIKRKDCEKILSLASGKFSEHAEAHLKRLFPRIETYFSGSSYSNGFDKIWRSEARICSPEYFDKFFTLSIPKGDVSREKMEQLILDTSSVEKFTARLTIYQTLGVMPKVLSKFQDYTKTKILEKNISNVIKVIFNNGDLYLPDRPVPLLSFSDDPDMDMMYISHELLLRLNDRKQRFKILKAALQESQNGLYVCAHKITKLSAQHSNADTNSEKNCTLAKEDVEKLKKILVQKIEKISKQESFKNHIRFAYLMSAWEEYGGKTKSRKLASELVENDHDFLSFVSKFTSQGYQSSGYVTKTTESVSLAALNKFIVTSKYKARAERIKKNAKEKFSKEEVRIAKMFLKAFTNKDPMFDDDEDN